MKNYKILPIPSDSAWDRKSPYRFLNTKLKVFFQGVWNIIRWIPTIYKDRDWDSYYIYNILQKKIENQRKYLVKANRHTAIYRDNFWMTITLNLIEKIKIEYYSMEYIDDQYVKYGKSILAKPEWENFHLYLNKYKRSHKEAMKKYDRRNGSSELRFQAMYTGMYRQDKARKLLFKILEEKMEYWWD